MGSVLTSALMVAGLRLAGALLSVCLTVLLSRSLGAEGFGIYSYALTAVAIAAVPIGNGWATLLLRSASIAHQTNEWIVAKGIVSGVKWVALLGSLLFVGIGMIITLLFPTLLSKDLGLIGILLLAAVLFFDQLAANRVALLRSVEKPQYAQVPDQLARPVLIIAGLFLVISLVGREITVQQVFMVLVLATFLNCLIGHVMMWRLSPNSLLASATSRFSCKWVRQALLLSGGPGLIILNSYTDILLLGFFVEAEDIGRYKVATQIGTFSGLGYVALNFIAAQKFAAFRRIENKAELQRFSTFCSRLAFAAVIPLPIILYIYGEQIIGFVFGLGFLPALPAMIILCILQIVSSGFGMCNTLLVMNGMEKYILVLTATCLVLNILLCVLLIPRLGIVGAAVANLLATGIWNAALWFTAYNKLSIDTSIVGFRFRPKRG